MTLEERKLNIVLQLANNANSVLISQLAERMEEVEQLKAKLAEGLPTPNGG